MEKTKALAELAKIDAQAERQRAEVNVKLDAIQREQDEWLALLRAGKAAAARLAHARDHLQILHERHTNAAAKFDKLVGGFDYSAEWHRELMKLDPMVDNAAYGPVFNCENPFVFHARTIAALELGIARIAKGLPDFERAGADAHKVAKSFAKAHGWEYDFDFGREADAPA